VRTCIVADRDQLGVGRHCPGLPLTAAAARCREITVEGDSAVEETLGDDGKVVGARLKNLKTGDTKVSA
jgi:hypothetical protein